MPYDFALCAALRPELVLYATALTHDRLIADEVVQQAMYRALKVWATFEPLKVDLVGSVRAWMFRIVRNETSHYWRYTSRMKRISVIPEHIDESETAVTPERREDGEISDEIAEALEDLREEQRIIVVLADIRGESYREIAMALSIPIGTVMSRLHRGRRALAIALRDYAEREWGLGHRRNIFIGMSLRAGEAAPTLQAPERPQAESDSIDRVVRRNDQRELVIGQTATDALASR